MYKEILQPLLFKLDPEKAHYLTANAGQAICGAPIIRFFSSQRYVNPRPETSQFLMGLSFVNPVGIAAGFDKNISWPDLLRFCGFGYAEFGSITARTSDGNPAPRLFRITEDQALINRMGLNNDGAETICRRIQSLKTKRPKLFRHFPAGINIAKTHNPEITGDGAVDDYVASYRHARQVADYITLNISCPNTREGITFENADALTDLLDAVREIRLADDPPILIKFSPDTELSQLESLIELCEQYDTAGYVLCNTSTVRDGLNTPADQLSAIGNGGLSGAPLFERSLERVARVRSLVSGKKVLIGCGGINNPERAIRMLKAGANLLQLYTGFVYEGPALISAINDALIEEIQKSRVSSFREWLAMHHTYRI